MKKRILSALLVLVLLVAVSAFAVEAEGIAFDESTAVDGVVTAYCDACKENVQWTEATLANDGTLNLSAHAYIPSAGLTVEASTLIEGTVCLYLNGTLKNQTAVSKDYTSHDMIRLTTAATEATDCVLNVMGSGSVINANPKANFVDSSTNTSGGINKLVVYSGTYDFSAVAKTSGLCYSGSTYTEVEIHGGTITGAAISYTSDAANGGAINLAGTGKFTMTGGTIQGGACSSAAAVSGGNIRLGNNSTFVMSGGIIQDGAITTTADKSAPGGNVRVGKNSTFTMTGGKILNGRVTATGDSSPGSDLYGYGGNVYVEDNSTVAISGGEISGGIVNSRYYARGGNAYFAAGCDITISGDAVLKDGYCENTKNTTAYGGNICVGSGATFTMTGGKLLDSTVYANGGNSASNKGYGGNLYIIGSSTNAGTVSISGGEISGGKAYAYYDARGGNIAIGDNVAMTISDENGDTLISDGLAQGRPADCSGDVHRGGKGGNIAFESTSGTLTISGGRIKDGACAESNQNGTTNFTYKDSGCRGGNMYITAGKTTITGGTISQSSNKSECTWMGGNLYVAASVTIDGEDALIIGGCAVRGGNVAVTGGSFTLNNGTIRGGYASTSGGNIHAEATVNMNGGKITQALTTDGYYYRTTGTTSGTGGMIHIGGGTFTMDGEDAVVDGIKAKNGGTICVGGGGLTTSKRGTFILKNGTINGGTATANGGTIQITEGSKMTISGGTVNGGSAAEIGNCIAVETGGLLTVANGFTNSLDVAFVGTAAELLAENKIVSTAAAADNYTNGGKVIAEVEGVKYPVVGVGTELVLAEAAVCNGKENIKYYATVADASNDIGAVAEEQYVKLMMPVSFELTQKTVVDFNGQTATVTGAQYLIAMDEATNDYDAADAAKVTFTDGAPAVNNVVNLTIGGVSGQRKYVALQNEDGSYSFHRYYISMRNTGLRVTEDKAAPDLIFSATFRGTEAVAKAVTAFGIDMQGEGAKEAKTVNYMDHNMTFQAGKTIYGKNVNLVFNDDEVVTNHGAKSVTATAFIQLGDIRLEATEATETSLKTQVEYFAANYASQSETGKAIIDTMLTKNETLFNTLGWTVTKQEAAA